MKFNSFFYFAENKEEVDMILQRAKEFGGMILPNQPQKFEWGYSGDLQDLDGHTWGIVSFYVIKNGGYIYG